jgi:hypothetical protein
VPAVGRYLIDLLQPATSQRFGRDEVEQQAVLPRMDTEEGPTMDNMRSELCLTST